MIFGTFACFITCDSGGESRRRMSVWVAMLRFLGVKGCTVYNITLYGAGQGGNTCVHADKHSRVSLTSVRIQGINI